MASIVTIEYDGNDITDHCVYEECSFEAQMAAVPGTFTVTLKDLDQTLEFITGKELTLDIDGTRLYGGFVTQVTKTYFFPADDTTVLANVKSRKWVLNGVDYNILLDKLVFHNSADYTHQVPNTGSATSDANVIRTKFDDYFDIPSGFDFTNASFIIANHLYSGAFTWPQQGMTMRQVLDLWGLYGSVFWIDADKQFNFLPVQDTTAAYGFSDKPSAGFYGFREGEFIEDATAVINDALVWGGSEWANNGDVVFARRENSTSISDHGRWQVGEVRVGEANYKIQSEVTGRANTIVDGNESGTFEEGSQGMVNPEKQFRCTWFNVDVPSHLRPGEVVPINLWVFSDDAGVTPFEVSLPLRQLTITFPIINPDGEAFVQFEGFFGVLMSDPKWLWSFLRQSTNNVPRPSPTTTSSNSTGSPPAGSTYQGTPSPAPDGSTTVFSILYGYVAGSLQLYVNGLLQNATAYSESNPVTGEITLTFAPAASDTLFVKATLLGTLVGASGGGSGGSGSTAGFPPQFTGTQHLNPSSNTDPMPGYLSEITDSTWGTKIMRVTNVDGWRNNYAVHQSWNLDQSKMMFPGYGGRILNGTTYADLGGMNLGGYAFPCWSNTNADWAYGVSYSNNTVGRWSASSNSWTTIHTFGSYDYLDLGGYAGNVADNDRISFMYYQGSTVGVVVYDAVNDAVISSRSFGTGDALTTCQMSRSGNYVMVGHGSDGNGSNQGTWLYNASDFSTVRQLAYGRPHADMGQDASGNDIFVYCAIDAGPPSNTGYVDSHRLLDGSITHLTEINDWFSVGHVSCTNYDRPGWAYLSSGGNLLATGAGNGQVVAFRTDGSTVNEVFGWHHNGSDTNYDSQPFWSASRDGLRGVFGGKWGNGGLTIGYSFVAGESV